ncbi:MAG: antirestriction protein ArdA, partial [Thomasclavelia sp.]
MDDMRVYIANLGKYNEGELVGDWFSFPIDEEDVAERIGLNSTYYKSQDNLTNLLQLSVLS